MNNRQLYWELRRLDQNLGPKNSDANRREKLRADLKAILEAALPQQAAEPDPIWECSDLQTMCLRLGGKSLEPVVREIADMLVQNYGVDPTEMGLRSR